jgi:hypothetical protein
MVLVPAIRFTVAVQLLQLLAVVTFVQAVLFAEHHTFVTATLSLAVPVTVNVALLHSSPGVGEVMLTVGMIVRVAMLLVTLPDELVMTTE